MQTSIIKYYKVLTRHGSPWYKIILLIQRGKTSSTYILRTQDREALEALTSTYRREVRDKISDIIAIMLGKLNSKQITAFALSCEYPHPSHHCYPCRMKRYFNYYVL